MPKYTLKGLLPNITFESVNNTFKLLSRMPLGFGMFAQQYSPIRTKVARATKQGLPADLTRANNVFEEANGAYKPTKGLGGNK